MATMKRRSLMELALLLAVGGCGVGGAQTGAGPTASGTSASKGTASPAATSPSARAGGPGVSGTSFPLTVTDFAGEKVTFESSPKRMVVLSGSSLNALYDAGGTAVATVDITENLKLYEPKAADMKKLPSLGATYNVNYEALVGLKPDLVVVRSRIHTELIQKLRDIGIKAITVDFKGLDDLATTYEIFGAICGTSEHAQQRMDAIKKERADVLEKWPKENISAVMVHVTAKALSVKLDNSIVGDIAHDLGVHNIASDVTPDNPASDTTQLDIEEIVRQQPDYVFVTSMVKDNAAAKATFGKELQRNTAWQAVNAIKNNKVIYLPQQYFLYNAGPYYADSIKYLAASLRPDIYGDPVEP